MKGLMVLIALLVAVAARVGAVDAAPSSACRPLRGLEAFPSNTRGYVVGDIHGTAESPDVLFALVCRAWTEGHAAVIAFELPRDEQPAMDAYFRDASPLAEQKLLESPSWHSLQQDGRHSAAVVELLQRLRVRALAGASLRVFSVDPGFAESARDPNARDRGMAQQVRALATTLSANERLFVFVGNTHARKTGGPPVPDPPPGTPTESVGYLIADLGLQHLNVVGQGGTLWTCTGPTECGVTEVGPAGPRTSTDFDVRPPHSAGYDGEVFVGSFTASPPAYRVSR